MIPWLRVVGTFAAGVIVVALNVLAVRHSARWDLSTGGLYSLSPPTMATLERIERDGLDVDLFVFSGAGDPVLAPLRSILDGYRAAAPRRLHVRFVDPDRQRAETLRLQAELDVHTASSANGRTLTDAQLVVRHAGRIWYVHQDELVQADPGAAGRVSPRMEAAITAALRSVLDGERTKVCFVEGHHEASLDDVGPNGLSSLRQALAKDNWAPEAIDPERPEGLTSCGIVAVMAPADVFPKLHHERVATAIGAGAAMLLVVPPEVDPERRALRPHGLDGLAALAGVQLDDAIVIEGDPGLRKVDTLGISFDATLAAHASVRSIHDLLVDKEGAARIPVSLVRPLSRWPDAARAPEPLLTSGPRSFAMHDVAAFLASRTEPVRGPSDRLGPLDLGFAAEAPIGGGKEAKSSRRLVLGTIGPFVNATFRDGGRRGTAAREAGLSWLAWLGNRAPVLDVPARGGITVAFHLSEDELSSIDRYALLWLPGAVVLVGVVIVLQRRWGERRTDSI